MRAYQTVPVGRLAIYLGRRIGEDPKLQWLGVRGEISGLREQPNGNVYFDLKDKDALLNCVAWSEAAAGFPPLRNGDEIVAVGAVGTFARRSTYQLNVMVIEAAGSVGKLHAQYEERKRKLEAEGLFATARKRPLPRYPFRVGLVSSRTANGAGDFLVQARALAPHVSVVLFETPVQGEGAAPEIVRAIERASRADLDLIVLARGGGSFEDLFVFSDERVVRALAAARHPTVAAIGHEADAPLVDFVADARAATPSTAAQTVLPRRADLVRAIEAQRAQATRAIRRTVARLGAELARIGTRTPLASTEKFLGARRQRLDLAANELVRARERSARLRADRLAALVRRLDARAPQARLATQRGRLGIARERLGGVMVRRLERSGTRLRIAHASLRAADPTALLARGYALVRLGDRIVRDVAEVAPGTQVSAQLARGTLYARVESVQADG
jgi:exodeoxyribonuclease VII large subunit